MEKVAAIQSFLGSLWTWCSSIFLKVCSHACVYRSVRHLKLRRHGKVRKLQRNLFPCGGKKSIKCNPSILACPAGSRGLVFLSLEQYSLSMQANKFSICYMATICRTLAQMSKQCFIIECVRHVRGLSSSYAKSVELFWSKGSELGEGLRNIRTAYRHLLWTLSLPLVSSRNA